MRKIISYSLWGDSPIYNKGFVYNYLDAKKIYADWEVVIYYDDTIEDFTKNFISNNLIESYNMTDSSVPGELWRFFANDLENISHIIFRDCDSRLSLREKLAVDEWVDSDKTLHVMRDHPFHKIPLGLNEMGMLAGMWGIKAKKINMGNRINEFLKTNPIEWGCDQKFIFSFYEEFKNDKITHDEFFGGINFPIPRKAQHFIGERMDENNNRIGRDYKAIPKNIFNRIISKFKTKKDDNK